MEKNKNIICHFKERGCWRGSVEFRTPCWWWATWTTLPHPPAAEPGAAQARPCPCRICWASASPCQLYLSWQAQRGNAASLPGAPRPSTHRPQPYARCSLVLCAPSPPRDLEQRQPQDGPRATVTMNWEVRTYFAHSAPTGIPGLKQVEAGSSSRKIKWHVNLTRAILVLP